MHTGLNDFTSAEVIAISVYGHSGRQQSLKSQWLNFMKVKQRSFKPHALSDWTNVQVGDIATCTVFDFLASTWDKKTVVTNPIWGQRTVLLRLNSLCANDSL